MSNDDEKTNVAFEAIVEDAKKRGVIDAAAGYRLKRRFRINSTVSKVLTKIVKSWITWLTVLIGTALAELTNLINLVN